MNPVTNQLQGAARIPTVGLDMLLLLNIWNFYFLKFSILLFCAVFALECTVAADACIRWWPRNCFEFRAAAMPTPHCINSLVARIKRLNRTKAALYECRHTHTHILVHWCRKVLCAYVAALLRCWRTDSLTRSVMAYSWFESNLIRCQPKFDEIPLCAPQCNASNKTKLCK